MIASGPPHVLKVWLGVSMLPVRYLCSIKVWLGVSREGHAPCKILVLHQSVVRGKQGGHAPCKILVLHQSVVRCKQGGHAPCKILVLHQLWLGVSRGGCSLYDTCAPSKCG